MDEIDEHEQECLFHFKEVIQKKAKIEILLIQSNEFSDKSNSLLKKYALDEQELTEVLDEARHLLKLTLKKLLTNSTVISTRITLSHLNFRVLLLCY